MIWGMARPKVPLITKRDALAEALRIIDEEGIEALSIRRLAGALNVNGASFYYHFENKEAIIAGAAELALDGARAPAATDVDWREWIFRNAEAYREALIAHPDLIPILLRRHRLGIGLRQLDASVVRLEEQSVPTEAVSALMETLEAFAVGSALYAAWGRRDDQASPDIRQDFPHLYRAHQDRELSLEAEFEVGCRSIIGRMAAFFEIPPAQPVASKSRRG